MGTSYDRRINLYINGQEVANNIKSIRGEMTKLINEQARMTIGSQEYIAHASKIRQLKAIMTEHNEQINNISKSWSLKSLSDGLNRYFALITAGVASITGVVMGFKQLVKSFNDFEERIGNLSALTGLAGKSLDWLSQRAKELSVATLEGGVKVRQGAQDIVDAFTKVGSARPELLKDKEALSAVTENSIILANAAKTELQPAIEALTMVMNQYNVPASEARRIINAIAAGSKEGAGEIPYITAAFEKAGTVAADAGLSIETLVATIETLAPRLTQPELAGRGLKAVLIDLQKGADDTNPAIVGMTKAFENLAKKQLSMTQLTAMFGVENVTVAKILINNVGELAKYEKAVTGTNVAIEQATINTDNNNSRLDQAKNRINLVSMELGQKLAPALTLVTGWFGKTLAVTLALVNFVTKYGAEIVIATSAVVGYTLAVKIQTMWLERNNTGSILSITLAKARVIWLNTERAATMLFVAAQALLAGNIERAGQAMRIFNMIVKLSPIGLLVGAIMAIGTALIFYTRELSDAEKAQKSLEEINLTAQKSILDEKISLEQLLKVARDETLSKELRLDAMDKINKLSPEFLGNITLESVNTATATTAIDKYIESLMKKARAQAAFEALKKNESERLDLESGIGGDPGFWRTSWNLTKSITNPFGYQGLQAKSAGANRQERLGTLEVQRKSIEANIETPSVSATGGNSGNGGLGKATEDLIKIQEQALEAASRMPGATELEIQARNKAIETIEKEIRRLKELGTTKEGEEDKSTARKKKKETKLDDKDKMEAADAANKAEIDNINKRHLKGLTNEDQYNAELLAQESAFLRDKMSIFKVGSKEYEDAAAALSMNQVKLEKHAEDLLLKAEQQLADARIENIQDGFDKEIAIEKAHYEEQIALLKKQLVDKTELSDEEKKLNELTNATIEEQTRAHLQRVADLESAKEIEKQMSAATYNLATATTDEEMYAAKREMAQSEYDEEFAAAKTNSGKMAMAEKHLSDKILAIKTEEKVSRLSIGQAIADAAYNAFGQLAEIAGKESALGKALFAFQQAAAVGQIIFSTAIANAQAVAAFPLTFGQPWVTINTISAGISIAAVLAQAIKGFSAGGYTGDGETDEPAGIVHKGEYVIPKNKVKNIGLSYLDNIFGNARLNNGNSLLSLNPMVNVGNEVRTSSNIGQFGQGVQGGSMASAATSGNEVSAAIIATLEKINKKLDKPITAKVAGYGGEGSVAYEIRKIAALAKSLKL